MSENIAIEFKDVDKTYRLYKTDKDRFHAIFNKNVPCKEVHAINHVSIKINKGESVALFGRNGAGKSTLLKMITQVTYPTSGKIDVNGRVSALLELTAGFDSEFTGIENIEFRGHLLGLKESEIKKLVPMVEDFAELGEYMYQPVRTYSSGMKARLGFAINVNINPEILIVDEALSVGDVSFRKKCLEKVRELLDRKGITFLFVTHSTSVAGEFCKRGIVMRKGEVKFDGDIKDAIKYYEELIEREDAIKKRRRARKRLFAEQQAALKAEEQKAEKEAREAEAPAEGGKAEPEAVRDDTAEVKAPEEK